MITDSVPGFNYSRKVAEQEQTISQLRASVERLRKENEENRNEILELQTLAPLHSFEWAIGQMRQGKKVAHERWVKGYFIKMNSVGFITTEAHDISGRAIPLDVSWQLYEEPKKELKVGQCWEDSWGKKREIIAIRNGIVSYFYEARDNPDWQSEKFFFDTSAHKLLGDAE